MAFKLGNHSIDEILYAVAQDQDEQILYTADQLSSASIEISAESTDITDKNGNVVRTRYTSKTGTFNSTNAFLHPQLMNAASGSDIETASSTAPIQMPRIVVVEAGATVDLSKAKTGTIKVIGLFGNGANDTPMTDEAIAAATTEGVFTAPAAGADKPIQYLVKYERDVEEGIKLVNDAETFPQTVKLTLMASYFDVCDNDVKPCYIVLPKFVADPNTTISLDRETQEMDFNGNLQIDFCSTDKALYYIYYPGDEKVVSGVSVLE